MIVVVEQYNAHKYSRLMDEMFRLRARIFHDRLKWDVRVTDGKERDKYDDEAPVYIIYTDEQQREVKGSLQTLADYRSNSARRLFCRHDSRCGAFELSDDFGKALGFVLARPSWIGSLRTDYSLPRLL